MKMNQLFAVCGIAAALVYGACTASAQDNNGGGGGGGYGGGRGGYGGGRGNFDPAQMQKDFLDFSRNYMNFTNDDEWAAVQPLVQKVVDARRDAMSGMGNGFRKMMEARRAERDQNGGGGQNGGDQNRRFRGGGMFGGTPSPEYTALENAVDNNAPAGQIQDLLARYQASEKAKQDKLKQAEDGLRQVLTPKQEAAATVIGLLD